MSELSTYPADSFWVFYLPKDLGAVPAYVVGHTWFDARRIAQIWFLVGFDELKGEPVDERTATIKGGRIIVEEDTGGGVRAFQTTRALTCGEARRHKGLREWKPVAQQSRREDEEPPRGVQANGQGAVHSPQFGPAKDQHRGAKRGKAARPSPRVR